MRPSTLGPAAQLLIFQGVRNGSVEQSRLLLFAIRHSPFAIRNYDAAMPQPAPDEQIATAENIFREYLRDRGLKYTDERRTMLQCVMRNDEHFEAEQLLLTMRQAGVRVGKATIYRTLKLLVACGIVKEVHFSNKQVHYEHTYGQDPHDHMVCRRCPRCAAAAYGHRGRPAISCVVASVSDYGIVRDVREGVSDRRASESVAGVEGRQGAAEVTKRLGRCVCRRRSAQHMAA